MRVPEASHHGSQRPLEWLLGANLQSFSVVITPHVRALLNRGEFDLSQSLEAALFNHAVLGARRVHTVFAVAAFGLEFALVLEGALLEQCFFPGPLRRAGLVL